MSCVACPKSRGSAVFMSQLSKVRYAAGFKITLAREAWQETSTTSRLLNSTGRGWPRLGIGQLIPSYHPRLYQKMPNSHNPASLLHRASSCSRNRAKRFAANAAYIERFSCHASISISRMNIMTTVRWLNSCLCRNCMVITPPCAASLALLLPPVILSSSQ